MEIIDLQCQAGNWIAGNSHGNLPENRLYQDEIAAIAAVSCILPTPPHKAYQPIQEDVSVSLKTSDKEKNLKHYCESKGIEKVKLAFFLTFFAEWGGVHLLVMISICRSQSYLFLSNLHGYFALYLGGVQCSDISTHAHSKLNYYVYFDCSIYGLQGQVNDNELIFKPSQMIH